MNMQDNAIVAKTYKMSFDKACRISDLTLHSIDHRSIKIPTSSDLHQNHRIHLAAHAIKVVNTAPVPPLLYRDQIKPTRARHFVPWPHSTSRNPKWPHYYAPSPIASPRMPPPPT